MSSVTFRDITISREDVLRAMAVFDQQYPVSFQYGGWDDPGNQHYFIRRDGRAYPPRFLLSVATNMDPELFAVDGLTYRVFDELGFEVVDLTWYQTWRHKSANNNDETNPETHPLSSLGLSVRSYNALARRGVTSIAQLAAMSDEDLFRVRNLGQKSVDEIREALIAYLEQQPISEVISLSAEQDPGTEYTDEAPPQHNEAPVLEPNGKPTALEVLDLPVRAHNALVRGDIKTIGQLASMSDQDLFKVRNLGSKSLIDIRQRLETFLENHPLQPVQESSATSVELLELEPVKLTSSLIEQEVLSRTDHVPLKDISLGRLALSAGAERELRSAGIWSIGDLAEYGPVVLKQSTVSEVKDRADSYLSWLSEQDPDSWENEITDRDISPLHRIALKGATVEAMITDWFSFLSDRQQFILRRRFGLLDKTKIRTLEEVGLELDLTRERVRQIEKQALKALSSPRRRQHLLPLSEAITQILDEHTGVMRPQALLGSLTRNYSVQIGAISHFGLFNLVATVFGQVEISERDDVVFLTSIALQDILAVQHVLVAILRESDKPLSRRYLLKRFKQTDLYQASSGGLSDEFIVACLRSSTRVERDGTGHYALRRWSWRRKSLVARAMRAIGEPTHYSEITTRFNKLAPERRRLSDHNLHAYLGRFPKLFVRVGHGVYGLAEWGLSNDGKVGNTAYKILCDAGRPLHIDPLTQEVLKTWHVNPGSVLAAVETDDRFIRIGRGVYALREQVNGDANSEAQIDFGDVFADKLEHWQEELDQRKPSGAYDAQSEVDAIRSFGSDFFND